jgi:hypothetical protein
MKPDARDDGVEWGDLIFLRKEELDREGRDLRDKFNKIENIVK